MIDRIDLLYSSKNILTFDVQTENLQRRFAVFTQKTFEVNIKKTIYNLLKRQARCPYQLQTFCDEQIELLKRILQSQKVTLTHQ